MPSKGAIEPRRASCDRSRTATSDLEQFLEALKPCNLHRKLLVCATDAGGTLEAPGVLPNKHEFVNELHSLAFNGILYSNLG